MSGDVVPFFRIERYLDVGLSPEHERSLGFIILGLGGRTLGRDPVLLRVVVGAELGSVADRKVGPVEQTMQLRLGDIKLQTDAFKG